MAINMIRNCVYKRIIYITQYFNITLIDISHILRILIKRFQDQFEFQISEVGSQRPRYI